MAGTTRLRRQSRASGHLDMRWISRGTLVVLVGVGGGGDGSWASLMGVWWERASREDGRPLMCERRKRTRLVRPTAERKRRRVRASAMGMLLRG